MVFVYNIDLNSIPEGLLSRNTTYIMEGYKYKISTSHVILYYSLSDKVK